MPQPFHAKDIETLKSLPAQQAEAGTVATAASLHLTAAVPADGFGDFAAWAAADAGLKDDVALLAGLAGACLPKANPTVAVEIFGRRRVFAIASPRLGAVAEADDPDNATPDLILRDLRHSRITGLTLGGEEAPVLSLLRKGGGLSLTLECAAGSLAASDALSLLNDFAGRMEQPLRHLL